MTGRYWELLIITMCCSGMLTAQEWIWRNPLPQGNTLFGVQFVDSMTVVAVGGSGVMLRSVDRGETWREIPSPTKSSINSLSFPDRKYGWIAGAAGLMRTSDYGGTWTTALAPSEGTVSAFFRDIRNGIALGRGYLPESGPSFSICNTLNAGSTWATFFQQMGAPYLSSGAIPSDSVRIVVGEGGIILRSSDCGVTWTRNQLSGYRTFNSIVFPEGSVGYISGDQGAVLRTTDNGISWSPQITSTVADLYSGTFLSTQAGYVAGAEGAILFTSDGGTNWESQQAGTLNDLRSVNFVDPNHGTIVGKYGTLLHTKDGGRTWNPSSSGITYNRLNAVKVLDEAHAIAIGDGGVVLKSNDLGQTWQRLELPIQIRFTGISFSGPDTGFAVGDSGSILKTIDGGNTWQLVRSNSTADLHAVSVMGGGQRTTAVGDSGTILKTTDGGEVWSRDAIASTASLLSVSFSGINAGIAVSAQEILVTTDGGNLWVHKGGAGFSSVNFSKRDPRVAFVVGARSGIYSWGLIVGRTTNAGETWTNSYLDYASDMETLLAVSSVDGVNAIAAGEAGRVYVTPDGGTRWAQLQLGTSNTLTAIDLYGDHGALVVGEGGTILQTDSLPWLLSSVGPELSRRNSELPQEFSLEQNYPNPFNPQTTIAFSVPTESFVTLTIKNILGQKIATLVQEKKQPGNYKISWNAGNNSSGLYFYELTAGTFVAVKKMLLVR